ncbi:MAG TPA: DUF3037 domain-containing protein [Patescibacteria group bacterium]|nr:DUF3037 domain-containing protein [Patescibacteria group bacterium]
MNIACHYAIVRFMPFIETGEFANVGVVLYAPNAHYFGFKLLVNRHARVTNFFEQLDGKVFRSAMASFREELERTTQMFKRIGTDQRLKALDRDAASALWGELVKPKASTLRVSEPRIAMATDAAIQLNALFEYYVERNFVTREYQEKMLERGVRGWLREAELQNKFLPARVGNEEYHAQFPFVEHQGAMAVKVIKPLNLAYPETSKFLDHGGQWIFRVNALNKRNMLPAKVLFAVEGPADSTARGRAMREITDALEDAGVTVMPYRERQRVIEFARH